MPQPMQDELNGYWEKKAFQATPKEVEAAVGEMETKLLAKDDLPKIRRTQVEEMVKAARTKLAQPVVSAVAAQEAREDSPSPKAGRG